MNELNREITVSLYGRNSLYVLFYQFSPDQRLWIAIMKEKGVATSKIKAEFSMKWPGKAPPAGNTTIWKKLKEHHTVKNLNKGNSGR